MKNQDTTVSIDNKKITIVENKRSTHNLLNVVFVILGYQGINNLIEYGKTKDSEDLIFGIILTLIMTIGLIKEFVFTTYVNEIDISEISKVSVKKRFWGNRLLILKFKKRNREILIDKYQAEKIKSKLNLLGIKSD